jgi:hypothetical protein
MTVAASAAPSISSRISRDLPIPAGPETVTAQSAFSLSTRASASLSSPSSGERAERAERTGADREPPRQLVDGDLTRRDLLLKARGDVHGRPGGERVAGRPAGEHLARRKPDADLELDAELPLQSLAEPCNRVPCLHCCAGGAKRVVLVCDGRAEDRHHGVADELLRRAAVPGDGRRHCLEVPPLHATPSLRVERHGESRRIREVGEEDRRELPLRLRGRPDRERERRVLPQDRGLERPQARVRLDTQALHEGRAGGAVLRERIGLPPLPVEREHQLLPRALAERRRGDECLQLGDEVAPAEPQVAVDP